jgi:DNA primase
MSDVETIKDKLDVVDVIGSYIKLEKAGKNFRARCPFHNERTPSFNVSPDRGTYHCFGCGVGGDIFSFVEQFEGVDFRGALQILADRAGISLQKENPKVKDERERLFAIMETACLFFQRNLLQNEEAKTYLKNRGVVENTVRRWRLGYSMLDWRDLFEALLKKGFSEKEMLLAGLIKQSDRNTTGSRYYDTFRDRVMFPIFDPSGRVIGFSGRILHATDDSPKYLNSPDTPLFNKSEVLYGLHFAKQAIREQGYGIIVEGQMDLIMSHQAGVMNAVASSGTALTGQHLSRIQKIAGRVIFAFDADEAGEKASLRSSFIALSLGLETKVATLPEGKDPGDLAMGDGEPWKTSLRTAKHVIEFFLDRASILTAGQERNSYIRKTILPLIVSIKSSIDQAHFISLSASRLAIPERALWDDLAKTTLPEEYEKDIVPTKTSTPEGRLHSELTKGEPARVLFAVLLSGQSTDIVEKKLQDTFGDLFTDLYNEAVPLKDELLFEIEQYEDGISTQQIEELFLRLEERILQGKIVLLERDLSIAEGSRDEVKTQELLSQFEHLAKEKAEIVKKRQLLIQ